MLHAYHTISFNQSLKKATIQSHHQVYKSFYYNFVILNLDKTTNKIIVAINIANEHWLLAVIEPALASIKIFNSLIDDSEYTNQIITKLQKFMRLRMFINFNINHMECNQQLDNHNCGTFSKSFLFYNIQINILLKEY